MFILKFCHRMYTHTHTPYISAFLLPPMSLAPLPFTSHYACLSHLLVFLIIDVFLDFLILTSGPAIQFFFLPNSPQKLHLHHLFLYLAKMSLAGRISMTYARRCNNNGSERLTFMNVRCCLKAKMLGENPVLGKQGVPGLLWSAYQG